MLPFGPMSLTSSLFVFSSICSVVCPDCSLSTLLEPVSVDGSVGFVGFCLFCSFVLLSVVGSSLLFLEVFSVVPSVFCSRCFIDGFYINVIRICASTSFLFFKNAVYFYPFSNKFVCVCIIIHILQVQRLVFRINRFFI